MKAFLCTYAMNAVPVHKPFWAAIERWRSITSGTILVIGGRYRNPTSKWSKEQEHDEWWAPEVTPYLVNGRRSLSRNLKVYGDISISPTAATPLTGFEVFTAGHSAIFGHPKRALEVIPTGTRTPRVSWTTSACTVPSYTDSKAGKKGHAHHVLGGLIVEVEDDGTYFVRHVTANKDGSFTDLDVTYSPEGARKAERALSVTLGDWHAGREDLPVLEATRKLVAALRPHNVNLHDVLDFEARNKHRSLRQKYDTRFDTVEAEVSAAVQVPRFVASWGDHTVNVVRSNHDTHLERWLEDVRTPENDPVNAPYYHEIWARLHRERAATGSWPDAYPMEARRLKVPKRVRFLKLNEPLVIGGVNHGFHGHVGVGGSRGSPNTYVKLGIKVTAAHTHVPRIRDGYFCAGVTADLDHSYNDLPNGWLQAQVVQYHDGKRAIVIIVNGKFRGGK